MKQRPIKFSRGFTLIELMIVSAIIGFLASLAIASYQTYTVRAQVAEGLNFAAGAKVLIIDAYTHDGIAPANRLAAGMTATDTDTRGRYVQSVGIVDGRVDIIFGGARAHVDIMGRTLSFTPYELPGNNVIWRCGAAAAPANSALLNGGADHIAPTVVPRYLPGVCR